MTLASLFLTTVQATASTFSNALNLGYRPFLDPLPVHDIWLLLLLPLIFAIALVYKAIKLDDLTHLWKQSFNLAGQILVFMVLAAAALWLLNVLV